MSYRGGFNNPDDANRGGPMGMGRGAPRGAYSRGAYNRGAYNRGGNRGQGGHPFGMHNRGGNRGRGGHPFGGMPGDTTSPNVPPLTQTVHGQDASLPDNTAALSLSTPASAPPALALDPDLAPVHWTGEEFESRADLDKDFHKFYEERGWGVQPMGPGCLLSVQSDVVDSNTGVMGSQWQTAPPKAPLGSDDYYGHFDILVDKAQEEAETARKSKLKELAESLATIEESSAEWHKLRRQNISYSEPVRFVQLAHRLDNERTIDPGPHIDGRRVMGQIQDVRVGRDKDPNVETRDRFASAICALQRAKLLSKGEWQPGTIWGAECEPKSVWADEEDEEDEDADKDDTTRVKEDSDRTVPSTFHGFRARHSRPRVLGLGHHGYDDIYVKQRDGQHFTSNDVPTGPWQMRREGLLSLTSGGKAVQTISKAAALKTISPLFLKRSPGLNVDLRTILEQNEKASALRTALKAEAAARRAPGGDAAPPAKGTQASKPTW